MMIVCIWVHLLAAVAWIGGMLFLSLVLVPVFRRQGMVHQPGGLFRTIAVRFRVVVWVSVAILVPTGALLLSQRTESLLDPSGWPLIARLKVLLVAILISLTAIHDFWLGPRLGRLVRSSAQSGNLANSRLQPLLPWVARLGLLLSLGILLVAVALARS